MKIKKFVVVITTFALAQIPFINGFSQQIDYKGFPQWSWHKEDSTEYYLYTPSNIKEGEKYPIVLFMHGCCGVSYHATLRNCVDPPVRMWHGFGANTQSIPAYIISPATSRGWQQHFKNLKKVMDDLIANNNGDPQRIYACGFSMGGDGTFKIIQEYPDYFAAAIPMGMTFHGDSVKVKDIPIWANQGETDWFSRDLRKSVANIRHLNGYGSDTGNTWVTGINPRYSNFKGVGHGVQWVAASTQDLTGWAYSKVKDGNKYPEIFFKEPAYKQMIKEGMDVTVDIEAKDPDGAIAKVDVYINHQLYKSLASEPYTLTIKPLKGDNVIEAVAFDNKGKTSTATSVVKVNMHPVLISEKLPGGNIGAYYIDRLTAEGNGNLIFSLSDKTQLPHGLQLYPDGTVKGVPLIKGAFNFNVSVMDEDNEMITKSFYITIKDKNNNEVLVANANTKEGTAYKISKMMTGETPNFNSKDNLLTTETEEINFSNVNKYEGLTYIKTDVNDTSKTAPDFLSFDIDEDATICVAYEKLDHLFHSTIPLWLKEFKKADGEIVAQYRYFDVYSKNFLKGKVVLPGADAIRNGVGSNYFVMIKKH